MAVIHQRKCLLTDAIFVTDRNYDLPEKTGRSVKAPPENWFAFEKNIFKGWKNIAKFESFLNELCPTPFEFYCPHYLNPFNNFMADHPRCHAHHLIEEGLASFLDTKSINTIHSPQHPNWKRNIWSTLFYNNRFHELSFYRTDSSTAYCTDPRAFPDQTTRVVLATDFSNIFKNRGAPEMHGVLALDSAVETKYATALNYLAGIRRLIAHLQNTLPADQVLHVKLHPYQYVNRYFADEVLATLRNSLGQNRVVELPPWVALEAINPFDDAKIYMGISSLSIYAQRSGIKCYSFAQAIAELDDRYRSRLQQQPLIFRKTVEFI